MPSVDRTAANAAYYAKHRTRISTKMLARARQNRQDAIDAAGGRCVRCPATSTLQFDHVDARTKLSHKIWTWGKEKREAELAKCQLLCEPCHQQKTIEAGEHQWKSRISEV